MDWQSRLITTYIKICDLWNTKLFEDAQRMSNNNIFKFTDEEVMAVYIFGILSKRFTVKNIFQYASDHLREWFPNLGGYDGFLHRINLLGSSFQSLCKELSSEFNKSSGNGFLKIMDSFPIVLANSKRSNNAKVAPEIADKGYCASKSMYYYGVKLHAIGYQQFQTIPFPEYLVVSKASDHDLAVFKQLSADLYNCKIFADKAYCDKEFSSELKDKQNVELLLPRKNIKGCFSFLGADVASTEISRNRQPIESFFNWIQEKTGIQTGSKIRSGKGLIVHIFGKMAAALMLMSVF
jgi:hypothetical protein